MNYIDIALIILLALGAIGGFRKGLIVEMASLAALILGIWGAINFSSVTAGFLVQQFNWHWEYLNIISFILTFIGIVFIVNIIAKIVTKVVDTLLLGFLNKLAGLVFGLVKGALILSIVLVIFDKINDNIEILPEKTKNESNIYEPLKNLVSTVLPFIDLSIIDEKLNKNETQPHRSV